MDDGQIIDLYLERNEAAIKETSAKYGHRLYSLSFDIVRDSMCAEECVNDTYLKAWASIPPSEPRDHFFPFLATIIRRLSLNVCRERSTLKRKAFVTELSQELEQCIARPDDCECVMEEKAFGEVLNGFLKGLDKKKRNMFIRRYFYMDSIQDISKRFSMSESNVKTALFRMRQKLRMDLEKEGIGI